MDYHLRLKGFVGGWDFDADYAQYILDKYAGQTVNVIIDSLGGAVFTALSISAAFKTHGDVHVHYVAANASAATIASLGAKHVSIARDGWFLVHKCSSLFMEFSQLNADELDKKIEDLQKQKDQLDRIDRLIAAAYARRCKKTPEEMLNLMEGSPWLSAQEALDFGFVDEITDFEDDPKPVIDAATAAYFDQNGITLPDQLRASIPGVSDDHESLLKRVVASVKSAFTVNDKNTTMNKEEKKDPEKKDLKNVEKPDGSQLENEGKPVASPEDITPAVTEDLEDLKAQIDALRAENRELKEKLDKKPADEHKEIVDDKPAHRASLSSNLTKGARDLYNMLP